MSKPNGRTSRYRSLERSTLLTTGGLAGFVEEVTSGSGKMNRSGPGRQGGLGWGGRRRDTQR